MDERVKKKAKTRPFMDEYTNNTSIQGPKERPSSLEHLLPSTAGCLWKKDRKSMKFLVNMTLSMDEVDKALTTVRANSLSVAAKLP